MKGGCLNLKLQMSMWGHQNCILHSYRITESSESASKQCQDIQQMWYECRRKTCKQWILCLSIHGEHDLQWCQHSFWTYYTYTYVSVHAHTHAHIHNRIQLFCFNMPIIINAEISPYSQAIEVYEIHQWVATLIILYASTHTITYNMKNMYP